MINKTNPFTVGQIVYPANEDEVAVLKKYFGSVTLSTRLRVTNLNSHDSVTVRKVGSRTIGFPFFTPRFTANCPVVGAVPAQQAARYAGISDHVLMLCQNGNYAPAPEPRVYSSREQALKVAKVMAKKHGGTFVVFKAVANAVMPTTEPTVTEF